MSFWKDQRGEMTLLTLIIGLVLITPILIQSNKAIDCKTYKISTPTISENTWVKLNPTISPTPRGYYDMVYDSESEMVILMGGFHMKTAGPYRQNFLRDDLWAYSASTNTWTNITPEIRPGVRLTRGAMAYDSKHDVIILFGGADGGLYEDTWAYDYNTETWMNKTPDISPSARDGHEMVYDTQSEKMIMYGGRNTTAYEDIKDNDFLNDTWSYDYTTNTWTKLTPSISPEGRWFFDMVYDKCADRVILFGGYTKDFQNTSIGVKDDTWAFDLESNAWSRLNAANNPSPRGYPSMAYNDKLNQTLLMGGSYGAGGGDLWDDVLLNDTWTFEYETKTWTDVTTINIPGHRMRHNMVYIGNIDKIFLFGGQVDDEWISFNNENWLYTNQAYPPSEPRYLNGSSQDKTKIKLDWKCPHSDGGTPITKYRIYRGEETGNLSTLIEVGNIYQYFDTDFSSGQPYFYAISAINSEGESPLSNEVRVKILKQTPSIGIPLVSSLGILGLSLMTLIIIQRKYRKRSFT